MGLENIVNGEIGAKKSIVGRYARILQALQLEVAGAAPYFGDCSQREGVEAISVEPYKGVDITLVDESSLMTTGTYKDLDACVISSLLRRANIHRVVVSSGGNLASALANYARRNDFEVIAFIPRTTLDKLEGSHFDHERATVIAADIPEKRVKRLASEFAKRYGIIEVPDIRWRLAASAFRAMFLLEHVLDDRQPTWLAQTMCAGYGPTGIYNCFSELEREGLLNRALPRFLGFQQEANCPMVRAWKGGRREVCAHHVSNTPGEYLEPVLYNTNPGRNYTRLYDLMKHYGGTLESIGSADMERYAPMVIRRLEQQGRSLARDPRTGEIMERTGLLTGVGLLKAIDEGIVAPGERVAHLLTGGIRHDPTFAKIEPRCTVDGSLGQAQWIDALGEQLGLSTLEYRRTTDFLFDRPAVR